MVGSSASTTRLVGIRPAPLCRDSGRRSNKIAASASSLPSLVRFGMFKHANEAKSRFIHKHVRAATAALASETGSVADSYPRQWNRPCVSPRVVSEPLAVMTTETGLEDYRRRKRADQRAAPRENAKRRVRCDRRVPLLGEERYRRPRLKANRRDLRHERNPEDGGNEPDESLPRRPRGGAWDGDVSGKPRALAPSHKTNAAGMKKVPPERHGNGTRHHGGGEQRHQLSEIAPTTNVKLLPQGVSVLIGADGVRRSQFPRGCESSGWMEYYSGGGGGGGGGGGWGTGSRSGNGRLSKWEEGVVTRLCDPKLYTGTAATGHLPSTVDLEGGSEVLLKDASIAVKGHVGAQEVSWRLRLAERL